ncbi:MAG: XdhC family protein [Flavobacteriales bacterium]
MNNQRDFWLKVQTKVQEGDPLAILCVVESVGSSPGRAGFKLGVAYGSEVFGTIGGGIMEKKLVDLTYDLFDREGSFPYLKRQLHQPDLGQDRAGMICPGEQTVACFFLFGEQAAALVAEILQAFEGPKGARELEYSSTGIRIVDTGTRRSLTEDEWAYYEVLRDRPRIAIVGAGHVSLALSRQMDLLGFHVTVYDDRKGLHTWHANTYAQENHVVDYAQMAALVPSDPELYVVIASVGYRTDDLILRQLIRNRYNYLGLLGSAEKVRVMFEGLRKDGYTDEELSRVHAPIGLPIHSRTPEEIAVSIAAEVVGVKNR